MGSRPSGPRGAAILLGLVLVLVLVLPVASVRAQGTEPGKWVLNEAGVWDFAETLFREGEYYRAITEYKRLLYFFPQSQHWLQANLRIGEAYLDGQEPGEAEAHFSRLLTAPEMQPARGDVLLLRGVARLDLERNKPYPLRERHIEAAISDLRAIPPDWPGKPQTTGFVHAMEEPPALPSKSPWLAAGLSAVVPGAGSAYVGRYPEAALAFFVNGVFIYGTVDAFRQGREGLGAFLGVVALAFYSGAIYAAANGAHKYNDQVRADYLERQRLRFGLVPGRDGMAAVIERRF